MDYTSTDAGSNLREFDEATHKPRVSLFINGDERYYQCSDGGVTMYGLTQSEAFNNLKALR